MNEPIGSLCVLADADHKQWSVAICQGNGQRVIVRRFDSQDQAADFAIDERARRQKIDKTPISILFPDNCPCCSQDTSSW